MNRKIVCVLIISLCSTVSVFSQKIFNGRIVDAETNAAIPHVYIENSSRNIISESNSNGYFDIFTHPGDTLLFSCIGYYWAKHIVTTENNQTKQSGVTYNNDGISFRIFEANDGNYRHIKAFATEAEYEAWIKEKLNITA